MSVVLLIVILVVLIVVHEFGHFIVAKKSGIRVDEFGIGYPPRVAGWKVGETLYSINLLPFGGFVRIFGEDPDQESISGPHSSRSFINKSKWKQLSVLFAGIFFNVLFAWLVISSAFVIGLPSAVDNPIGEVSNPVLTISDIAEKSPAHAAELKVGDRIQKIAFGNVIIENPTSENIQQFVKDHQNDVISFTVVRNAEEITKDIVPVDGIVENQKAIGISMDMIGLLRLNPIRALWEGMKVSVTLLKSIVVGLGTLVYDAVIGDGAALTQVTGPVGIAGLVGEARDLGYIYILMFTAFISLNLAVINLIPFPALDGGRILFVIIEAIRGKRISNKVANTANMIGFALLLLLMVVVTYQDIVKLGS